MDKETKLNINIKQPDFFKDVEVITIKGKDGIDGVNGIDGIDGVNGIDGIDGTNGKDGVNGINGLNGTNGKDGITPSIDSVIKEINKSTAKINKEIINVDWNKEYKVEDIKGLPEKLKKLEYSHAKNKSGYEQVSGGGSSSTGVQTIVAGTNVTVDNTDPLNPIVNATGGGSGAVSAVSSVNGQTGAAVVGLQSAYNNSAATEILLDATRGAFSIQAITDGNDAFEILNSVGSQTFFATGGGEYGNEIGTMYAYAGSIGAGGVTFSEPTFGGNLTIKVSDIGKINITNNAGALSAILDLNGLLTTDKTFTFPNTTGTFALGTGVANQLSYWVNANTLGSLSTVTYPNLTELSYLKGVTGTIAKLSDIKLQKFNETPGGLVNSSNKVFITGQSFDETKLRVYLNGLRLQNGTDYTETTNASFTFVDAPTTGDRIMVDYQIL